MTWGDVRHFGVFSTLCCLALLSAGALGQEVSTKEDLFAAMVVKFEPYVKWPEGSGVTREGALTIGVYDHSREKKALQAFELNSDRVTLVDLESEEVDFSRIQIVYISDSGPRYPRDLLEELAGRPILVVSNDEQVYENGGTILLFERRGRAGFEISRERADQSGLVISSKLLRLGESSDGRTRR